MKKTLFPSISLLFEILSPSSLRNFAFFTNKKGVIFKIDTEKNYQSTM